MLRNNADYSCKTTPLTTEFNHVHARQHVTVAINTFQQG